MQSARNTRQQQPVREGASALRGGASLSRTTPAPVEPFVMPFRPGEILAGKYKVIDLVGTGGVAFVVSARHVGLDEVVALKFLRPEFSTHAEAVRRFTVEARANFKLKSPHVVRVLDVETLADGTPFIIMELLDGVDLGRVLETRGALPVELAVEYVRQACEGLASAHAAYVVHRDIKPENLFLTKTEQGAEQIKLLDFGISKVPRTAGALAESTQTTAVTILGSPPYMSPEQVRASHETDARTDIWSMGCVLYELLSGVVPFERDSVTETCAAILKDTPMPLGRLCPQVPPALEAAVMRCLNKDPDKRFQHIEELAHALAAVAPGGARYSDPFATGTRAVRVPSIAARDDAAELLRDFRRPSRGTQRNQLLIAAALVAVLAGTYFSMQRSKDAHTAHAIAPRSSAAARARPILETQRLATPALALAAPAPAAPSEDAPSALAPVTPVEMAAPAIARSKPAKLPAKNKTLSRWTKPKSADPDVGF
jgi:serine/threonine protein kinase